MLAVKPNGSGLRSISYGLVLKVAFSIQSMSPVNESHERQQLRLGMSCSPPCRGRAPTFPPPTGCQSGSSLARPRLLHIIVRGQELQNLPKTPMVF